MKELITSGRFIKFSTGGYRWRVVSKMCKNPWDTPSNVLAEDWPTKEHALHCAQVRSDEGYWVDVYHIIGHNINAD